MRVSCAFTASLRGTVSGAAAGAAVTLINGSSLLALTANGPFAFAELLIDGTAYNVRVLVQPAGVTCTCRTAAAASSPQLPGHRVQCS